MGHEDGILKTQTGLLSDITRPKNEEPRLQTTTPELPCGVGMSGRPSSGLGVKVLLSV